VETGVPKGLESRYYDVLPALSVRGAPLRRSLRLVTVAWMFGVVWLSCTSGDQVRAFARMLGFNDFAFGLLAALPFIATFGQLNAAILIERTRMRKYTFIQWGTIHRLLWLAVAAVPLLIAPGKAAAVVVLAVLGVSYLLGAMSSPGWVTWMSDLVPRRIRGRYFASRMQWGQVVQVIVVIAIGLALDAATARGKPETLGTQRTLMWTICTILAIGGVFGAVDILIFRRIRDVLPPITAQPPEEGTILSTMRGMLIDPLKEKVFRNYVLYGATITFTATFGGWFYWRLATEGLGFSKLGTNCLFMVIGPMAGMIAASWWGRLQDRYGRRPLLIIHTVGTCLSITPWLFASRNLPNPTALLAGVNWVWRHLGGGGALIAADAPVSAYLLGALGCVIGGVAWRGVGLAQTGVTLAFADGQGRSKYVAASAVLISIGGTLGGLAGGVLAQSLEYFRTHPLTWGPLEWTNWHFCFLVSLIIRVGSLAWLVHMPDPGARPVRYLLRHWSQDLSATVTGWLFYPLRVFGWGRPPQRQDGDGDEGK